MLNRKGLIAALSRSGFTVRESMLICFFFENRFGRLKDASVALDVPYATAARDVHNLIDRDILRRQHSGYTVDVEGIAAAAMGTSLLVTLLFSLKSSGTPLEIGANDVDSHRASVIDAVPDSWKRKKEPLSSRRGRDTDAEADAGPVGDEGGGDPWGGIDLGALTDEEPVYEVSGEDEPVREAPPETVVDDDPGDGAPDDTREPVPEKKVAKRSSLRAALGSL